MAKDNADDQKLAGHEASEETLTQMFGRGTVVINEVEPRSPAVVRRWQITPIYPLSEPLRNRTAAEEAVFIANKANMQGKGPRTREGGYETEGSQDPYLAHALRTAAASDAAASTRAPKADGLSPATREAIENRTPPFDTTDDPYFTHAMATAVDSGTVPLGKPAGARETGLASAFADLTGRPPAVLTVTDGSEGGDASKTREALEAQGIRIVGIKVEPAKSGKNPKSGPGRR